MNLSFSRSNTLIHWGGAGPRKESHASDKISEVVETLQDMFGAASSKISLQKTSAYSHLHTEFVLTPVYKEFLSKLCACSMAVVCISLSGAETVLSSVVTSSGAVGIVQNLCAAVVNSESCPSVSALRDELKRLFGTNTSKLIDEMKQTTANPFNLLRADDGDKHLKAMLGRRAMTLLSQTRDGILLDPSHYPDVFRSEPRPALILFKFTEEAMISVLVEPILNSTLTKPEDFTVNHERSEHFASCENSVNELFKSIQSEGDGFFTWKKLGEVLSYELQLQCHRGEITERDAEALAANLNNVFGKMLVPRRETITTLPLILLTAAKGQLMGRPFTKIHPLCRVISGEEIEQWIRK
jgi:hypothetical protein